MRVADHKLQDILQREPIERSALMGMPMCHPDLDAGMFVKLTMDPEQQTPPELVEYVHDQILRTCAAAAGDDDAQYAAYQSGLSKIWPTLEQKMLKSYGLAEYLRTRAAYSLFLPYYYATLYHPMALEAPYGWAVRLDGKFMQIPRTDVAYTLCANEPIFDTARVRTALQQEEQLELGDGAKVVVLGAAMLPEYNHFDWQSRGITQNVVAYDNAPKTAECLRLIYSDGDLLTRYGIDYRYEDFWNAFKDPDLQGKVDLVAMEGGLSYYRDSVTDLLRGVVNLLRPGGYFCGEVEIKHLYTIRCGILGWQLGRPMQFEETVDSAIDFWQKMAGDAGLKLVEAVPDERSLKPAMVWFKFQKV